MFDDSIRSLLGFHETILYIEYYLSPNPVVMLSSDNIFIECDIDKGVVYKKTRQNNSQLDYDSQSGF